jgi:DNA helicase HerA-like ATPase
MDTGSKSSGTANQGNGLGGDAKVVDVKTENRKLHEELAQDIGSLVPAGKNSDVMGHTMFDVAGSEDGTITVLLGQDNLQRAPAQALVRIESRGDGRNYLGVVSAGPFALPDSLKSDSPVLVAVATHGGEYLPSFHGRVQVTLLGEKLKNGTLAPPRLRPLPHSPVYRLSEQESAAVLKSEGDLRLGLAVGHDELPILVPSNKKWVLPRHTAILGTTGAGKSTTVAGLVCQAQRAGMSVVVLDVEGEYTFMHEPTVDRVMQERLVDLGLPAGGVPPDRMAVYYLAGRECSNPAHPGRREFSIQFARLSPYAVMEMLGLNDAQTDRFLFAYEVAKAVLRDLGIFPERDANEADRQKQERLLGQLDEFERGFPRLTLSLFLDIVTACKAHLAKAAPQPFNTVLRTPEGLKSLQKHIAERDMPGSQSSWGKLNSLLWRLNKLRVFHGPGVRPVPLNYADLLKPGQVSVVDLSDAGLSELCNIAVADVLRGVQEEQERAYRRFERGNAAEPPRVLIIIEEAHEFLSEERIDKTPVLFQQIARLAKRGRKRWLGLTFVTQLPQHLPRQVLSLVNSFILHRLSDSGVVANLKKSIAGIDESLWSRLPGLAPGQAVVSFPHLTKPLLTAIDPSPAKLRMID